MINETMLNDLARKAHANAVKHGFWSGCPTKEHAMMLVLTELAEAVEADRREDRPQYYRGWYEELVEDGMSEKDAYEKALKGTKFDELADVCIRLLDLAGKVDMDFCKYNPCRYYRSFDKYSYTENAYALAKGLTRESYAVERRIVFGIHYVQEWMYHMDNSLEWHIKTKMAYNEGREYLHGKRY